MTPEEKLQALKARIRSARMTCKLNDGSHILMKPSSFDIYEDATKILDRLIDGLRGHTRKTGTESDHQAGFIEGQSDVIQTVIDLILGE